ncbi:MAG: methyltransferase domain-containing protein [Candidatus Thermoplasmatota archaeon]|nr:methyltransferase domain-containing protein [Candidatus Thermoplasmatota archaeon]
MPPFHLPDMNWFEFEVLSQLLSREKYGNEILMDLNLKFEMGSISSGKLYPALHKLEKRGYIKRTKKKGETGKKGVTRGVERVYFSITKFGRSELENVTRYTSVSFIHGFFNILQKEASKKVYEIIERSVGPSPNCGIARICMESGMEKVFMEMDELHNARFFFLEMSIEGGVACTSIPENPIIDVTYIPSKIDDIPLKDGYLDAIVVTMLLHDLDEWEPLITECVRTLRPGGIFVVVDFARFDSYVLESLMQEVHKLHKREEKLMGLSLADVSSSLSKHLEDVKTERMKEILLAYGRKSE